MLVKQKVPWQESEVRALADGVQKFDKSWAAILTAKSQHFHPSRNAVDLKVSSESAPFLAAIDAR
jgi:hypothetical protein